MEMDPELSIRLLESSLQSFPSFSFGLNELLFGSVMPVLD